MEGLETFGKTRELSKTVGERLIIFGSNYEAGFLEKITALQIV
jgi:hypothetical protein